MTKRFPSLCLAFLLLPAILRANSLSIRRVIDGDTLLLSDGVRVRLIGVDTPEHHTSPKLKKDADRTKRDVAAVKALGKEATRFVKRLAEGRPVRLEYEKPNRTSGHKDRYDRTLAYVYFTPRNCDELEHSLAEEVCELKSYDEGFLNALIIEAGYGNVYTKFPFHYMDNFRDLEKQARENGRGLWKEEGLRMSRLIKRKDWDWLFAFR